MEKKLIAFHICLNLSDKNIFGKRVELLTCWDSAEILWKRWKLLRLRMICKLLWRFETKLNEDPFMKWYELIRSTRCQLRLDDTCWILLRLFETLLRYIMSYVWTKICAQNVSSRPDFMFRIQIQIEPTHRNAQQKTFTETKNISWDVYFMI